ncbi:MAG: PPC domain-containing protein [Kofleriaceae bacterium]|nr:PPC domain-containing protein [Myxococcales bacterium]MCB9573552.1 PPC domain-containing protein [Kofleriaceae bacterium]
MARARGIALLVAVIGGGALVTACSLILDFSDPPAPPDATVIDAISASACDFGEPNDSRTTAFPLDPVDGQVAGICGTGDRDFYSFAVADGQELSFEILFAQDGARGDLDMRLLDVDGNIIARSLSTDANEKLVCPGANPTCPTLAAGDYFIEIFGFTADVENSYTINFDLTGGTPVDAGVDAM